jgi:hypothetical protein
MPAITSTMLTPGYNPGISPSKKCMMAYMAYAVINIGLTKSKPRKKYPSMRAAILFNVKF